MEFEIYDKSLRPAGICDQFYSACCERRYGTAGIFKIAAPATENNLRLLREGNIALRGGSWIITKTEITPEKIIAEGKETKSLLAKKVLGRIGAADGTAEEVMRSLISKAGLSGEISLGEKCGAAAEYSGYFAYYDLFSALRDISAESGVGFTLMPKDGRLEFQCICGSDRRESVIFSEELDNLTAARLKFDREREINAVTAYAYSSDGIISVRVNPKKLSGLSLREGIVRGNAIYKRQSGETVADTAATEALLRTKAYRLLREPYEEFYGGAAADGNTAYGRDYFLGDIVTVKSRTPFLEKPFRIDGIAESEGEGYSLYPIFIGLYDEKEEI